jgi:adhesin/invasin
MVAHPSSRFRPGGRLLALGLLAFIGGAGLACDKMPLVAPSGSALTLIASTNVLPVNGSADITAIVIEGGQSAAQNGSTTVTAGVGTPVQNGTLVTFTTTLGRLEPAEARTEAGRATVKLFGDGRSGTAVITAYSGAANNTLNVAVGAAGAARVLVTASPQSLPATGGSTTIAARVEDGQGNGLLGVPVSFSSTAGTLTPTSALSDNSGFATSMLTTTAAATVTASAGGSSGSSGAATTLTGSVNITLKPRTTITITPPATTAVSVPAKFTIGVGTTTIVTDVAVDFGDGNRAALGSISSNTDVYHLYAESGIKSVTVTATDSEGGTTSASTQVAVAPLTATGLASPSTTVFGQTTTLSVTVLPAGASIEQYIWDFGEGGPVVTASNSISHDFQSKGTKTVTVQVVPTVGKTLTVLIQFEVS